MEILAACRTPVQYKTSASEKNPGRAYVTCSCTWSRGAQPFFEWTDEWENQGRPLVRCMHTPTTPAPRGKPSHAHAGKPYTTPTSWDKQQFPSPSQNSSTPTKLVVPDEAMRQEVKAMRAELQELQVRVLSQFQFLKDVLGDRANTPKKKFESGTGWEDVV
jgi:hypothetical protein